MSILIPSTLRTYGIVDANQKPSYFKRRSAEDAMVNERTNKDKSLIFIYPDYHCSFVYRNELRKMGWKADIYVPHNYPKALLYGSPDLVGPSFKSENLLNLIIYGVKTQILYLKILRTYKYHFYHGNLEHFTIFEKGLMLDKLFGKSFRINLLLAKMLGRKILYLPSGAPDEEMPNVIAALGNDEESVAVRDRAMMEIHFKTLKRYSDFNIGFGLLDSSQYRARHLKYKSIDLVEWRPDLEIPDQFLLPPTKKIRILHSFMFQKERRLEQGGCIKGTAYIENAIKRLKSEGYEVEQISFDGVPTGDYKFYQSQADIVVEEIIRGSWGSTAVECMALGKPVVTYIRSDWEKRYYSLFPGTKPLPLVNANKWTIYQVLKELLDDTPNLNVIGGMSRDFAIKHLNPEINVREFVKAIEGL